MMKLLKCIVTRKESMEDHSGIIFGVIWCCFILFLIMFRNKQAIDKKEKKQIWGED